MVNFEYVISTIDNILDTKRKRHITSGVCFSISLLFAGFTITVLTIKEKDEKENDNEQYESIY